MITSSWWPEEQRNQGRSNGQESWRSSWNHQVSNSKAWNISALTFALVNKYDVLSNKFACDANLNTCVASLEQEKQVLNDKLEKLTSEHMALQACHKELECSHEKLIESYIYLEVAHAVVISSITSTQPPSHTCTCSHVNIELSCAKPCCSQASQSSIEHVFVETCDDLITQENDQLMQEVFLIEDHPISIQLKRNTDCLAHHPKLERSRTRVYMRKETSTPLKPMLQLS
jgi:hypothetical protein